MRAGELVEVNGRAVKTPASGFTLVRAGVLREVSIVAIGADAGTSVSISGTSAKGRNAFEQIIAAAENGRDFDTILCYDISRFSRGGTNETGYYLHRLRLAGVDVVFTADGIPEGDEGELIQGLKSWQARQFSVKLARDTIRGQISNIRGTVLWAAQSLRTLVDRLPSGG